MKTPYADYKPTTIPWLTQIPAHWEIHRAKRLFRRESRPVRVDDDVVTAFRDGQVTLRKNRREDGFTNAMLEIGYQGIRKGDLIIHGMDAFAGAIGVSDSDGKSSPVYNACTLRVDGNTWYFCHAVREMSRSSFIQSLARGIRERSTDFRFDTFGGLYLPVPPREEQEAIAVYLANKSKLIDTFIKKKKRLIAFVKEQKQAMINRAVTQGVWASAERKQSGITWLEDVPSYWQVLKLKYLLRERSGRSETGNETLLSLSKHKGVIAKSELEERGGQAENLIGYKKVSPNDLVVNKLQAVNGLIGVSGIEGITSPDYAVYQVKSPAINVRYLGFLLVQAEYLATYKTKVRGIMDGYIRLYTPELFDIRAIVPPIAEQNEILAHIEFESIQFDEAVRRIEQEIELAKEYKLSLIAEVVTGKFQVA